MHSSTAGDGCNMKITATGNTEVPAYLVLIAKGYQVSPTGGQSVLWLAQKDQNSFSADGMLELLGLVALAESRGLNWRVTEEIDAFLMMHPKT
jgi:hypothetical protein